jgi:hypothetical protein
VTSAQISLALTRQYRETLALRRAIAQGDPLDLDQRLLIERGLDAIAAAITQTAAAAGLVRR